MYRLLILASIVSTLWGLNWNNLFSGNKKSITNMSQQTTTIPTWDDLHQKILSTSTGQSIKEQELFRSQGAGLPHTDAKLRLFGTTEEPRVLFYRDTAAWCPYCQKVWILLEEKQIPYKLEKINMRSYGDKPAEFLRMVPNGLLPAIVLDGQMQTDSLAIMLNLDRTFTGSKHKAMLPNKNSEEYIRAEKLFRLERTLFSSWCSLVFRQPSRAAIQSFEDDLDQVNTELSVTASPWFLDDFSIVDLTYITHLERMFASVAYWSGIRIRGSNRWPAIERWIDAFEAMPSYLATKSDYYTHIMDIPPQYGPGYSMNSPERTRLAGAIDGTDGSWSLPLAPFNPSTDVESIYPSLDPGDEASRHQAAYRLINNHDAVINFALRGAGSPGAKRFQAPLADPYAVPNLDYRDDMDLVLRNVVAALLDGHTQTASVSAPGKAEGEALRKSLSYLRARVGVPRDMSYPAARQLRAHLTWAMDQLK